MGYKLDEESAFFIAQKVRSNVRELEGAFLAKELTNYSLPEIGESFGGRDHTTVLHACKKIKELRDFNNEIEEDYRNLFRALTI